jgi:hypothetical protein
VRQENGKPNSVHSKHRPYVARGRRRNADAYVCERRILVLCFDEDKQMHVTKKERRMRSYTCTVPQEVKQQRGIYWADKRNITYFRTELPATTL